MNIAKLRSLAQQILEEIGAASTDTAAGRGAPVISVPQTRTPIAIANVVPPAWSDAVAAMRQANYIAVLNGQKPHEGELSAQQALASYGNRPETTDFDYQRCRDSNQRLAGLMDANEVYGVAIPRVLKRELENAQADPNPSGFLTGEKP